MTSWKPRIKNSRLLALMLFCLMHLPVSGQPDAVDLYVEQQMRRFHLPGLAIAVIVDHRIVKSKAYGLANIELTVPMNTDTVFEIGSLTKQFTAVSILLLVEDEKIKLDDKISKYLNNPPEAWADITVRQLLTHTSGIKSYINSKNFSALTRDEYSQEALINQVSGAPLKFAPGSDFLYSSTNYYLLGMIIEKVSGKKYWEFVEERLSKPQGLGSTRSSDPKAIIDRRASGYRWGEKGFENADRTTSSAGFAAGSLVSTIIDLAKWTEALDAGKVIARPALEQMLTPAKLNNGKIAELPLFGAYGFGWFIRDYQGHKTVFHTGETSGFSCVISRFVSDKLTIVILTNRGRFQIMHLIADAIATYYIPGLQKPEAM